MHAVLADNDSREFHPAAERLLEFVRVRLHPEERLRELETALLSGAPTENWGQDLTDYLWLLDHPVSTHASPTPPQTTGDAPPTAHSAKASTQIQGSDLTNWILTFQQDSEPAFQHFLQRWHETKSLPWLVAAIMKLNAKNPADAAALSAAASKVSADSPSYLTLTFHRLRLLEQSGQSEAARREIDQLLAQRGATMPISARNQFRALRMKLAANLSELLQFAPRISTDAAGVPPLPAGETDYKPGTAEYAATRPHFDSDGSAVLTEKLPLRILADAAKLHILPSSLRRDVAIAAWTRAILLKNEAIAKELTPLLTELVPEVKSDLADYNSAPDADSGDFAAVFAILRNPGFRPFVSADPGRGWFYTIAESGFDKIDTFQDNWWCSLAPPQSQSNENWVRDYYRMFSQLREPLKDIYPGGKIPPLSFLKKEESAAAEKERDALLTLPSGPRWLGKIALDWAQAHPDDPRVPEALHLVVRAWRYDCTESSGENYSRAAFDLLHHRYPGSEWTKKTPHWFK